jgi:hypothetical protein
MCRLKRVGQRWITRKGLTLLSGSTLKWKNCSVHTAKVRTLQGEKLFDEVYNYFWQKRNNATPATVTSNRDCAIRPIARRLW